MGGPVNNLVAVGVKLLNKGAKTPSYASLEAAGADLHANLYEKNTNTVYDNIVLPAGGRMLIKTGIAIELMPGTWAEIRGRSGLANKHGIAVLGGVIDSDYRGDIGVILHNTGLQDFTINHGDRIAQLIVVPVLRGTFEEVEEFSTTERGENGFGSTGVSA
jgi:dUTP pyrophosphatase